MANARPNARGKNLTLADGNAYIIPFMPMGRRAVPIAKMMDEIGKKSDESGPRHEEIWAQNFNLALGILRLNYPNMTEDEAEELLDVPLFNDILSIFTGSGSDSK
jgi:hypothetical protein